MGQENSRDEPGHVLSASLIAVLVVLVGLAFGFGMSTERPTPPGMGPVFMGLFLVALGSMFFASYFLSGRSYFLRWLLALSMGLFPKLHDRRMAFFLATIAIVNGIGAIAAGLGFSFLDILDI